VTTSPAADQAWPGADKRAAGSEVQIVLAARELLARDAIAARVVSMPCVEWFTGPEPSYQEKVLPQEVRARVCVEAGVALGWRASAGDDGECVSPGHFGASADYWVLPGNSGFTAERGADAARRSLARAAGGGQAESVQIDKER
jgi:transketolase